MKFSYPILQVFGDGCRRYVVRSLVGFGFNYFEKNPVPCAGECDFQGRVLCCCHIQAVQS